MDGSVSGSLLARYLLGNICRQSAIEMSREYALLDGLPWKIISVRRDYS